MHEPDTPRASDAVSWYVTFGFDSGHARQYSEIVVPASLSLADQERRVRQVAHAEYGLNWAFQYPPDRFADAIQRHDLTLRERLEVTS